MTFTASPRFLPTVLWIDAASAAACALLQVAAAPVLAGWLGLPTALLASSGAALFAVAGLAAWAARSKAVPRAAVYLLVAVNAAWVLGCAELLVAGGGTPFGQAYLVLQALFVGALALLEWLGLRRATATAWA